MRSAGRLRLLAGVSADRVAGIFHQVKEPHCLVRRLVAACGWRLTGRRYTASVEIPLPRCRAQVAPSSKDRQGRLSPIYSIALPDLELFCRSARPWWPALFAQRAARSDQTAA
jgi:hypothetical protein